MAARCFSLGPRGIFGQKRAYAHEARYEKFCTDIAKLAEAAIVDDGTGQA
ncbi:hypothetical protein [Sphingobium sp. CAP-1]|nr:hypothetical protein [Sphingobium sp. CAP-1]QGP80930.1 hypothetical protein GL174_17825 [Sphingobium sp. CAP-1]